MTTALVARCSGMYIAPLASTGRIPTWIRVVSLAPLGVFCAMVTLLAMSLSGWHLSGTSTAAQLRSDAPVLGLMALAGATAGALLLLALTGRPSRAVVGVGIAVGCVPVTIRLLAYLTDAV